MLVAKLNGNVVVSKIFWIGDACLTTHNAHATALTNCGNLK